MKSNMTKNICGREFQPSLRDESHLKLRFRGLKPTATFITSLRELFKGTLFAFLLLILTSCQTQPHQTQRTGPWNLPGLYKTPPVTYGVTTGLVQQLYYEGQPLHGKPTRIFAYLGRPNTNTTKGRFPAVVLVHGGGGKAFSAWAEHWANCGYVALAMDLSGNGPDGKRLEDGGPDQSDATKFRNFTETELRDMWSYHAVAAVIRGHSLLASLPDVDRNRICITGISWGGYLTCIVAGLDHRLKAAVPVYGCGFLGDNSFWKEGILAQMNPEARALWLKKFDPSEYLSGVQCPILFLNGSHDFAYPFDSYQKSYHLVNPSLRRLSIVMKLPHGHIWTFPEPDEFIDRSLKGVSFPQVLLSKTSGNLAKASTTEELKEAELNYTRDRGPWQQREWTRLPATISARAIEGELPDGALTFFFTARIKDGLRISSEYQERLK